MIVAKKPEQSAGQGRKQCPSCRVFVGVRTKKCECGHDFAIVPAIAPKFTGSERKVHVFKEGNDNVGKEKYTFLKGTVEGLSISTQVLVPAGVCSHLIKDYSEEGILDWAKSVFRSYYDQKQKAALTTEALLYFSKQSTKNSDAKEELVKKTLFSNVSAEFFV